MGVARGEAADRGCGRHEEAERRVPVACARPTEPARPQHQFAAGGGVMGAFGAASGGGGGGSGWLGTASGGGVLVFGGSAGVSAGAGFASEAGASTSMRRIHSSVFS